MRCGWLKQNELMVFFYNDKEDVELSINDTVKVVEIDGLESCAELKNGSILTIIALLDLESNYIQFFSNGKTYEFYGHRVVKI